MKTNTDLGGINVSTDAIASLTGAIVSECYGVVGMASRKFPIESDFAEIIDSNQKFCLFR